VVATVLEIVVFPVVEVLAAPALLEVDREVSMEAALEPAARVVPPVWVLLAVVVAAAVAGGVGEKP
jgi:hypothetical protein